MRGCWTYRPGAAARTRCIAVDAGRSATELEDCAETRHRCGGKPRREQLDSRLDLPYDGAVQGVEAISSCRRPTDRSRCDSELHRCCITTSCITHVRTVNTADRRSAASLPREGDARMGIAWPASPAAAAWVEVMSSPRYVTPHETSRRCALTPDQPAAVNGLCYHQRCSGWPRACGAATVALVVIDVSRPAMKLAVARAVGR